MLVTLLVFQFDKSKVVNELQPLNILYILDTLLVLKFDKSSVVNEAQL